MYTCPKCESNAFLPKCEHCGFDTEAVDHSMLAPADLSRKKVRSRPLPNPFRARLASFLGRDDFDVMNEYSQQSKMGFKLFTTLAYVGTRPIEFIRQILPRINKRTIK